MVRLGKSICMGLMLLGAASVAHAQPNGKGAQIRIQEYPGSILNLPTWVAIEKGFCSKYGLQCAAVALQSGPLGLQTLASGSIEASFASNDVTLAAASRGNDVQLVVGHSPNNYYTLNVRADYPLPNRSKGYPEVMKDLKGSKMGVTARGSAIELTMRAFLIGAGMTGDEVTYVAVGSPATSYPAMLNKQIDGTVSFEPFNTLCTYQKTCVDLVNPGRGEGPALLTGMNGGFAAYAMRRNYIESNPQAVEAFIAAITDTIAWISDPKNLDEVIAISKKKMSLGSVEDADKVMAQLVKNHTQSFSPAINRKSVDAVSTFLLENKLITNPVSSSTLVYSKAPR